MPRPAKGPRLFLRKREGRPPVYVIRDRDSHEESTGCGLGEERGAEEALARYLGQKHESAVGTHNPAALPIADMLNFYGDTMEPGADAAKAKKDAFAITSIRVGHLIKFFGLKPSTQIKGSTCRDYVRWRNHDFAFVRDWPERLPHTASDQTARRELVILAAAVSLYHAEFTLDAVPSVTLPDLAPTTRRALSHSEAAALLAGALGFYLDNDTGKATRRAKFVRTHRKRTARFIIIGLYSGSRHSAITAAKWIPCTDGPWVDIDRGILHRRGAGEAETSKKRPPARIPPRLLAHLRRWHDADMKKGIVHIMSRSGEALAGQLRKGWAGAREDAGLGREVTPHVLRHTAATWLAQGGLKAREAADYLGMSEATFEKVYYSAHPDYQNDIGPGFAASKTKAAAIKDRIRLMPQIYPETRQKP